MELKETNALLAAIGRAHTHFLDNDDSKNIFNNLLNDILDITNSQYGFIIEVINDSNHHLLFKSLAHTGISYNHQTKKCHFTNETAPSEIPLRHELFQELVNKKGVITANNIQHNVIKFISLIPTSYNSNVVGLIGIAHTQPSLSEELLKDIRPLFDTCGRLITLQHERQQRDESQLRLSAIVDTAVDAIIVIDKHGIILSCNPATEKMFAMNKEQLLQKNINSLMPTNFAINHDQFVKNYLDSGVKKIIGIGRDIAGQRANGEIFPMHLSVSEFNLEGERFFTGIVRDLTGVHKIQRDLARFKETLDQVKDSVFTFDPNTLLFTYANEGASQQVGYSMQELLTMHPYDIKPTYTSETFKELIAPLVSKHQESLSLITEHRHKQGHLIPVEIMLQYVPNIEDNDARFVAVVRDISERRAAEKALRESDERFKRSQVFANIGTWDWNIETNEFYWSERIAPLIGYAHNDIEHSYDNLTSACHPDDRIALIEAMKACIQSGVEFNIEHRCIWPDGSIHWLLERGDVVRDNESKPLHMLGVMQDVTDLAIARQELVAAKNEAERASLAKSDFLSSMSHELRTPLNAIMGFAQLFQFDQTASLQQKENAEEIYAAGVHLRHLIDDVLDLARIEAGHIEISLEPVTFSDLIQECLTLIKPLADKKNISIEVDFKSCDTLCLLADRIRLKQIFINLLSNGIKYNRLHGNVKLSCAPSDNNYVKISVIDTGIGIAATDIKSVFTPFSRLHTATLDVEGTGIGLSITKQFIDLMHGEIGLESVEGVGTTFWVKLKLSDACVISKQIANMPLQPSTSDQENKNILVVEDNPTNRKVMGLQLKNLGYTADMANNGLEALKILANRKYNLILTDIHMPEMDGYELTKQIRTLNTPNINSSVIAVTANAMESERERCLAVGMDDYITKPVDIRVLEKILSIWLNPNAIKATTTSMDTSTYNNNITVDITLINTIVGENTALYQEIIDTFTNNIPENIQAINIACNTRNADAAMFAAHRLKSAARSIGAFPLAQLCQDLEKVAHDMQWTKISLLRDQIAIEAEKVSAFLDQHDYQVKLPALTAIHDLTLHTALLVDDEPVALALLKAALEGLGVEKTMTAESGVAALSAIDTFFNEINIIFCDLNMPEMDGIEFLRHLAQRNYQGILVLLSGEDNRVLSAALNLARAHNFRSVAAIEKPVRHEQLAELLGKMPVEKPRQAKTARPLISPEELQYAINEDQFIMYFQPKVNPCTKEVVGAEALVRWQHPEKNFIMPDEFIPMAEELGIIDELTDLILDKSFAQLAQWRNAGLTHKVSINIAAGTIGRRINFPEQIIATLNKYNLLPEDIILEVTESGVMKDIAATLDTLVRLRLKGITLSIDDFGTGYSTFKQLHGIPFEELKVDKGFVMNALTEPASRAILESSVMLGQKLKMAIVAEGVETQEDWNLIKSMGCHLIQGYFVSRPLAANDFSNWLTTWKQRVIDNPDY